MEIRNYIRKEEDKMDISEKILKEEERYTGNFLKVANIDVELPDGNLASRDVIRHPGASAILPLTDEGEIILVKQFRTALNKVIIEVPAGKLEKGEEPIVCAKRELEEETGYKAKEFKYLGKICTVPGFCDEIIHLYLATGIYEGVKGGDEDEFTEIIKVSIEEMKEMVKKGEIIDTKSINCLCQYMLQCE